jgi:hypothetical protein
MNWHNSPHNRTFDEVPSNASNDFNERSMGEQFIEQSKLPARYGISKSTLSHRISKLGLKTHKEGRCCYLTSSRLQLLDQLNHFLVNYPGSTIDDFKKSSIVQMCVEQYEQSHQPIVDTPLNNLENGIKHSNTNANALKSVLSVNQVFQPSVNGVSNNLIERSMDIQNQEIQRLRSELCNANNLIDQLEAKNQCLLSETPSWINHSNKLSQENEQLKSQLIQASVANSYLTSHVANLENYCNQLKAERDVAIEKDKAWEKYFNEHIKPVQANPVTNVIRLVPQVTQYLS